MHALLTLLDLFNCIKYNEILFLFILLSNQNLINLKKQKNMVWIIRFQ